MQKRKAKKRRPRSSHLKTIEIERKNNGYGFSIVGENPCMISSSSVEILRPGDCLISFIDILNNGKEINIYKMSHDQVVELIANAPGRIRLTVTERFYIHDSSDDEPFNRKWIAKPIPHSGDNNESVKNRCQNLGDISAMMRSINLGPCGGFLDASSISSSTLVYQVVVGYLGTIEMQKQIANGSKNQIVKSCIRKMRQERRAPTTVQMVILPTSLSLKNAQNVVLASYPSVRVSFVSGNSDNESKYFGLVTSTVYADGLICDSAELIPPNDLSFSNSCHVFIIDHKIVDHSVHAPKAEMFNFTCTRDQITGRCLEFPYSADFVVNLLKSMYLNREEKNNTVTSVVRNVDADANVRRQHRQRRITDQGDRRRGTGNSPPSSEVTTTSSNSDSGIGFHNDCTNVSDRIVLVDFPVSQGSSESILQQAIKRNVSSRPAAIIHEVPDTGHINPLYETIYPQPNGEHPVFQERPVDVPEFMLMYAKSTIDDMKSKLSTAKSCDHLASVQRPRKENTINIQASVDNVTQLSNIRQSEFVVPRSKKLKKPRDKHYIERLEKDENFTGQTEKLMMYKLSPKVFGLSRPISQSFENLSSSLRSTNRRKLDDEDFVNWGSLQNITDTKPSNLNTKCDDTLSEPDLRMKDNDGYSATQPFHRRNQPSFSSVTSSRPPARRLARPSSVAGSENDISSDSIHICDFVGAASWATSFEKLLDDMIGIQAFAEFLKKEISAENIYFWTNCERYRQMNDIERLQEAKKIYDKYLSVEASDPVNVDSMARSIAHKRLELAETDLFEKAQKQIFNLMKFDSYQRFIKSDLYKQCIEAEQKGIKLQFVSRELNADLRKTFKSLSPTKLKKSLSNADDRRRKSLLPWNRKGRSESKERLNEQSTKKEIKDQRIHRSSSKTSINELHSSKSSLTSFESAAMKAGPFDAEDRTPLTRIYFPDGSTTVAQIKDESVESFVQRQLEKRGMKFNNFEVFDHLSSSKPFDVSARAMSLAEREIRVEQRVLFKLDLPNRKVISVKSKANKVLSDVLEPILTKYSYKIEEMQVFIKNVEEPIDITLPVTVVEQERLIILSSYCEDFNRKSWNEKSYASSNTLDEITNKVFNEVLQGKSLATSKFDINSAKSDDFQLEISSSNTSKQRSTYQAQGLAINRALKQCKNVSVKSEDVNMDVKKPLITKLIPGVKVQTSSKGEELLEDIKKAQLARYEDQRGTEINFDLPDFLKGSKEAAKRPTFADTTSGIIRGINKPQPAPRHSLLSNKQLSVMNRVQDIESKIESSYSSNRNSVEYEATNISDSYVGDTTMTFVHKPDKKRYSASDCIDPILSASLSNTPCNSSNIYHELLGDDEMNRNFIPPPLPPKPKMLMKPSNWGNQHNVNTSETNSSCSTFI